MGTCCGDTCADLNNDPDHCGDCSIKCDGSKPVCIQGTCQVAPCAGQACTTNQTCCGTHCCDHGQMCCVTDPISEPYCFTPTNNQQTCPP